MASLPLARSLPPSATARAALRAARCRATAPARTARRFATRAAEGDGPIDVVPEAVAPAASQGEAEGGEVVWTYSGPLKPADDAPEPVRFGVANNSLLPDLLTASIPAVTRLPSLFAAGWAPQIVDDDPTRYSLVRGNGQMLAETSEVGSFARPALPLQIYEFEGCPFCRKVREALCMLDLDAVYYPCPKGGPNWRPMVVAEGGQSQFPYLKDPNTGVAMYESDDIIRYLYKTYGPGEDKVPLHLNAGALTVLSIGVGTAARFSLNGGSGSRYKPSSLPPQPLVLWGLEGSPFVKVVRELMDSLEIPHYYRSCPRGSPKRQELFEAVGHFQIPYLEDPNTGVAMFESEDIKAYLLRTYSAPV